jgi:TolB-like protein/class 3 adenylate cyclase/tetratricopeptide (TPR) repeat protein
MNPTASPTAQCQDDSQRRDPTSGTVISLRMADRRLAAVMVTDIVGFTALMRADQQHAVDLVDRSHAIMKSIVSSHHGEWLDDAGDRAVAAFPSALSAVKCALQIQAELSKAPEPKLRIGVDLGDILVSGGHVYGDTVNIASLIERLADPEGLVITKSVFDAVKNHLDLDVVDMGEKVLRNIEHPIRLYELTGIKPRSRIRAFMAALLTRRMPQIAGAYVAAGAAMIQATDWLGTQGVVNPRWSFDLFVALVALFPSVLLIAYTHGAHGRDRLTSTEKIFVPFNALIAALAVVFFPHPPDSEDHTGPIEAASVAVLPFLNLSDDKSTDYFSRGLSEELINALAKIPGLYVASRTSSFLFESHEQDPREIARKLRVATILEGSVRKEGDRVRVTAQLIDGTNNYHLWTDTYERELPDIFKLQEDVALAVARELVGVLQPKALSTFAVTATATVQTYDYYLRGLDYLHQPPTAQSLTSARELFQRALAGDPDYAPAYAGICQVSLEQYQLLKSPALIDQAKSDCLSAYRLDEHSREVRLALGVLYRNTGDLDQSAKIFHDLLRDQPTAPAWLGLAETEVAQGNLGAAEQAFQTAIDMEPGNWHNEIALAEFLYWRGRYADALDALHRVIELSPDNARAYLLVGASEDYLGNTEASLNATLKSIALSPTRGAYRDLGLTYYYSADYEKALDAFQHAVALGPDDHWSWGSLADTYRMLGGHEADAHAAYGKAAILAAAVLERNDKDWVTLGSLAVYEVMNGAVDEGQEKIRIAVNEGAFLGEVHYYDAVIRDHLGQRDLAIDALQRAIDRGYSVRLIARDPQFNDLRNEARFARLIQE